MTGVVVVIDYNKSLKTATVTARPPRCRKHDGTSPLSQAPAWLVQELVEMDSSSPADSNDELLVDTA